LTDNDEVELSPNKWRVIFAGCNHEAILTDKQLHEPIETQFDPVSMHKENMYVCPGCSADYVKPGDFCMNSVLHKVEKATKLSPLDACRF
jgi:hypothetical protein